MELESVCTAESTSPAGKLGSPSPAHTSQTCGQFFTRNKGRDLLEIWEIWCFLIVSPADRWGEELGLWLHLLPRVHFCECILALLLHKPTSKDIRLNPQSVMIYFLRVCVLWAQSPLFPVGSGRWHCGTLAAECLGWRGHTCPNASAGVGNGSPNPARPRDRGDHRCSSSPEHRMCTHPATNSPCW